jgi:hypothetical protein
LRFFYVKVCVLKLIHYLYTIIITIKNNNIMNYLKNKIFRDFILDLKKSDITDFYMHIVDEIAIKSIYVEFFCKEIGTVDLRYIIKKDMISSNCLDVMCCGRKSYFFKKYPSLLNI